MSLLKIKTKPLKYEIIVKRARVEHINDNMKPRVSKRRPSANKIFNKNSSNNLNNNLYKRVDVSSIRVRSLSVSNNATSLNSLPSNYSSVSSNNNVNGELNQLKYEKIFDNPNSKMVFLPNVGPQVSYNANTLHAMCNNYKWEFTQKPTTVYHPGSIKFEITQYPSITMEYIPNMLSEE